MGTSGGQFVSYAAKTEVSSERSRAEIERILSRWKATNFLYGWDRDNALVGFTVRDRQVRFIVPMPDADDKTLLYTNHTSPRRRSATQIKEAHDQLVRQRWRALALVIKAKLEAVESGIVLFDTEFMAQIVLPDGRTVGENVVPKIQSAYKNNTIPELLPIYSVNEIKELES